MIPIATRSTLHVALTVFGSMSGSAWMLISGPMLRLRRKRALANRVDVRSYTLANLARLDNGLLFAYVIQLALDNQRCRAV